jgi:hypothetical protein
VFHLINNKRLKIVRLSAEDVARFTESTGLGMSHLLCVGARWLGGAQVVAHRADPTRPLGWQVQLHRDDWPVVPECAVIPEAAPGEVVPRLDQPAWQQIPGLTCPLPPG